MSTPYIPSAGDIVSWQWYGRIISGTVKEVVATKTTIHSKGALVTRNGTPENPAIIIEHKSGNDVIKLASELLGP